MVRFRISSRARRLSISVIPFQGICVVMPEGMSLARATQAVNSRKGWIEKYGERAKTIERKCQAQLQSVGNFPPREAKEMLISRVKQLAERYDFIVNRIGVRRQQTRWGSCSAANNISLNIKLSFLPDELRDFVIIHELVHTKVKNHGKKFWDFLEAIIPQARILSLQLKSYSGLLFLPE